MLNKAHYVTVHGQYLRTLHTNTVFHIVDIVVCS